MVRRLVDRFPPDSAVEIQFGDDPQRRWFPGVVVASDPPGVWVALGSGRRFFVTNTRRIRARTDADRDA